jgi:hypothetical protein
VGDLACKNYMRVPRWYLKNEEGPPGSSLELYCVVGTSGLTDHEGMLLSGKSPLGNAKRCFVYDSKVRKVSHAVEMSFEVNPAKGGGSGEE